MFGSIFFSGLVLFSCWSGAIQSPRQLRSPRRAGSDSLPSGENLWHERRCASISATRRRPVYGFAASESNSFDSEYVDERKGLLVAESMRVGARAKRPGRPALRGIETGAAGGLQTPRGTSRWMAFTSYPASCSRRHISSAIITLRCCPPVHPKAMVR